MKYEDTFQYRMCKEGAGKVRYCAYAYTPECLRTCNFILIKEGKLEKESEK